MEDNKKETEISNQISDHQSQVDLIKAANRLHHLSIRYVGALIEAATGTPVLMVPSSNPGIRECRDFIDTILLSRAEVNGLIKVLVDKGLITQEEWRKVVTEQYGWLTKTIANNLGVTVTDTGLMITQGTSAVTAANAKN